MEARVFRPNAPANGSAALKTEAPAEVKRAAKTRGQSAAAGQAAATVATPSGHRQITPVLVIGMLALAAVVIVTLFSYARLVIINDQVVGLRSQLSQLESDQTKLLAEYEMAYDLQEIETQMIASGQMNAIQSWQTYTLELSEPDAVEYFQESTWRGDVADIMKQVIEAIKEYF